ncbi:hypothetical protein [Neobacillus cucumis]|uniref:NAD(P)-dependent oxidoreductase n=1 Tax=Neobacillus cucumis TaxID=1740721 RepID=A0A2N5HBP8_9BACI|nr:hypothetical protein [Neobacillus cucumis]PLS02938.1 hypothetical protein CVD27_17305 [Neobacillus cucumis]
MDKAIIFGMYDFISFHIGSMLLNKGLEVIGIHIDQSSHTPFLEEKRLEVGRNANYKEIALSALDDYSEKDTANTTFILSLYDLYVLNKEVILQRDSVIKSLQQYIKRNKQVTQIVCILPIQLLEPNKEQTLETIMNQVNDLEKCNTFFYLPAVYGPWQPSVFMFQQALNAKFDQGEIRADKREWTGDILFVDDAVGEIVELIEHANTEHNLNYLIESGQENYWFQCAAQLQLDEGVIDTIRSEPLEVDKTLNRITIKNITPFTDSIKKQLNNIERLIK